MATKRPRNVADNDDQDLPSSNHPLIFQIPPDPNSTVKLARINVPLSSQRTLLCSLPPTCNPPHNTPTRLANSAELEKHYATYHAHVCEERGCGAVFPDERLLELHQTECHDPIAAVRKERGEKIFACLVPTCTRQFQTPKARRLHLIQAHAYPKEYFFAVTNKGVGGLLKRWGEGASMVRSTWKPRAKMDVDAEGSEGSDVDDDAEEEENGDDEVKDAEAEEGAGDAQPRTEQVDTSVDALASTMGSLTLVPQIVRFGRGARNAVAGAKGLGRGARGVSVPSRGRGSGRGQGSNDANSTSHTSPNSRGRARIALGANSGARGRGRGTGHSRTSTMDSEISVDAIPRPDQDGEEQVSINIDAALEALRNDAHNVGFGQSRGGRGQGGRGGGGGRRPGPRGRGRG